MAITKNKTVVAVALLLMFIMAISLFALPRTVAAQLEIDTNAHLSVSPNPLGSVNNLQ